MSSFFYSFFHNKTVDRTENGTVSVPTDISLWPDTWKSVSYKKYSLFKNIPLFWSDSGFLYNELLRKRISKADTDQVVSLEQLSYVLQCGYGLRDRKSGKEHRTVPSAGMRYPLEVYVVLFKDIGHCIPGVYHYGIRGHILEPVANFSFSKDKILSCFGEEWMAKANGVICMTSVFERMTDKYGSRGYRYILLEAGHSAQNMVLAATERNIKITPIGGVNEDVLAREMRLNTTAEQIVYVLAL